MELTLSAINKSFGDKHVLRDVGFTVKSGSAFGLLGRNGAGKTTTIRIIMGVFPADSGTVSIDGQQVSKTGKTFGYLPEERGLYPKRKILDQVAYIGMIRGMARADALRAAERWLERLDMQAHKNELLNTLSKGNQQKIQLAATLVNDPDIIILDEPFSGLDPVNASLLKDIVREQVEDGKIVIFSSHQMGYVEEFCDSVAILNQGEIVLDGPLRQIKRSYGRTNIFVRADESVGETAAVLAGVSDRIGAYAKSVAPYEDGAVIGLYDESMRGALLAALSDAGVNLEQFRVLEPTLEQIFIEKAGDAQ